jgi:putative transposase
MARIKVDAREGEAVYHCMSRTVNGERLFDDVAREVLRKQLWAVADFCGVEVVTYALMDNHFHVLLRVPQSTEVEDNEMLRRYSRLYPKPTRYQTARLEGLVDKLKKGGEEAEVWRAQQLALMGDVSMFMKLLKQRFTKWFNRSHNRFGTLWAERFKSVLVEPKSGVMRTMAAYIDLNAVRAGLVSDPKDYRFCGYAEAVSGNALAQKSLGGLVEGARARGWKWAQAHYRETLFGTGSGVKPKKANLSQTQLGEVIKAGGRLPMASVLRCRVRYFSDGLALGSQIFVQSHLENYRRLTGRRRKTRPQPLPDITDWGGITTLRGLRQRSFG